MQSNYKHHTIQAKTGIKGEAFFELLLVDYALPHRIVGSKDIGIDYICEWTYGDRPTGILFAAQIKTFSEKSAKPTFIDIHQTHNGLERYQICNGKLQIDHRTLNYWKGLSIPIFLFAIVVNSRNQRMDCFYRRYTPLLTTDSTDPCGEYHEGFYRANEGSQFYAFKDNDKKTQGFARDLFIDHVRCSYAKGLLMYLDPRIMGLNQFQSDAVFGDLFKEYEKLIRVTYEQTGRHLKLLEMASHMDEQAIPSNAPPEDEDDG
jgi:hypothetical protein